MTDKKKGKQERFNDWVRVILNEMAGDIFRLEKNFVALKEAAKISDDQVKTELQRIIEFEEQKKKAHEKKSEEVTALLAE
jgi:hypothetical protein